MKTLFDKKMLFGRKRIHVVLAFFDIGLVKGIKSEPCAE